jgi:hypothetical protein
MRSFGCCSRTPHTVPMGASRGPGIEVGEPPLGTAPRSIDQLIAAVRTLFLPQELGELDGRKVVYGLALLDAMLRERLERDGFLDALGEEIDLHANLSGRGKALYLPDAVLTLSDQPCAPPTRPGCWRAACRAGAFGRSIQQTAKAPCSLRRFVSSAVILVQASFTFGQPCSPSVPTLTKILGPTFRCSSSTTPRCPRKPAAAD